MSIVGKNQIIERVTPRLRTFHTAEAGTNYETEGTVAWKKAYMQKDYCESSIGYSCERQAAGGSGVQGRGKDFSFNYTRVISFEFLGLGSNLAYNIYFSLPWMFLKFGFA